MLALVGIVGWGLHRAMLAGALLARFGGPDQTTSWLARYGKVGVHVVRARVGRGANEHRETRYVPNGTPRGHIVLVHGMHRLGVDEPRLIALARNLASTGYVVATPEIGSLTQYRLDPAAIDDIAGASCAVARASRVADVSVIGISFAGGLAIMAASRPNQQSCIRAVTAIGAHQDLARVTRWFAGDIAEGPAGEHTEAEPHPYGAQLLMYADPGRFVPVRDVAAAHELLLFSLQDQWEHAREGERRLSAEGRGVLEAAFHGSRDPRIAVPLRRMSEEQSDDLARVSPSGGLGPRRVPTYLLHGATDPIIPSTEAYWLGRQLPHAHVLVSRALRHAESAAAPSTLDRARLVAFFAWVLFESDG